MSPRSIRLRLTAGLSAAVALLLALGVVGADALARRQAERAADTLIGNIATQIQTELDQPGSASAATVLAEGRAAWSAEGLSIRVETDRGERLASLGGDPLPESARSVVRSGQRVRVSVAIPWEPTRRALDRQRLLLAVSAALTTAAAWLGAWALVGRALAPIDRLARQAAQATPGVRLAAPSDDAEIARLVGTLNAFLERTEAQALAWRLFHAAAAHELRTPLHVLAGELELALSRPRTDVQYRETLEGLQVQVGRLEALARALLQLSRAEAARRAPAEPVDLAQLCRSVLADLEPILAARGLSCDDRLPSEWGVRAAPAELATVVRNALDNAARYATTGSGVRLAREGETLSLWNPAVLASGEAERLGEPLFRGAAPRADSADGSGLGLTLCRTIAETQGWSWRVRAVDGGVEVRLSLAQKDASPADRSTVPE